MSRMLNEIPGVVCPEPNGAFYAYPSVKGVLGKEIRGTAPQFRRAGHPDPGRGRGRGRPRRGVRHPGYFRLSYALGDEDLAEGVGRVAKLLSEAQ